MRFRLLVLFCIFTLTISAATIERDANGVTMRNAEETVRVSICGNSAVHVVAGPGNPHAASPQEPWFVNGCKAAPFDFTKDEKTATLSTSTLRVSFNLSDGRLTFRDAAGHILEAESDREPRRYDAVELNGERVYRVSERFLLDPREGLYGLGQHQSGAFNYRGTVVELGQANTDIALPFLISSNGSAILWNTASRSWFDNRFPPELKLTADAADAIDYYFLYGPEMDSLIRQYRTLTGHAPLLGKWAYGFFQSKDRYKSAQELLDIAAKYRSQHVPLDTVVQDWFWWKCQGDPEYTAAYLKPHADVPGALRELHEEHVHSIISAWAMMDPKSQNFQSFAKDGFIIPGTFDYDASNPAARVAYWNMLIRPILAQGWDGFWLDSSEPEILNGRSDAVLFDKKLFLGNGARYTNVFPLLHTGGVYDHWRASGNEKRVFILTRSAFLGQQRNATVVWSGDVYSTFTAFARQIPAGLNFALSGMPYWTTDIGGCGWPWFRDTNDPAYQELFTRWYEYGVFCPIFRTHGHRSNDTNELFSYGSATPTLVRYDKLRYRLLPYIYSLAWRVTNEDYTIQRPLIMDWRNDPRVTSIGDQFMFGPAILVNPVTEEGATTRSLYLPPAPAWYDFWSGVKLEGGRRITAEAPLERIPLYVRAGSILPLGPEVEYAEQHVNEPIEVRVYRGADADFKLYDDRGDTYAYEKGEHAIIPLHWDEKSATLTINAREGEYPGMPREQEFRIVVVNGSNMPLIKEARYTGSRVTVQFK
ncbi:MAG TPA: TIM-barrel domain-containing protein [Bryobacteraceae bacterium]|jgi:alpha-D-xyloside xylohydrolase|nr:TIM-barrel domain-containing protein [Bryobacteraceae bacterium]